MSNLVVRQTFETELETFLNVQVPVVPFYQTINTNEKPTDALWVTAEYYSDYNEAVCMGGKKRIANGTIDVLVYSKPGQGYTPAILLADEIEEYFYGRELTADIQIIDTVPPEETTAGDAMSFYGVSVSLQYQYYI